LEVYDFDKWGVYKTTVRKADLDVFYHLLNCIENVAGPGVKLHEIYRKTTPEKGLYFFFEEGEFRDKSIIPRVVKVESSFGNKENLTLYQQLLLHRGNISGKFAGGGNHRSSLLRKYIGTALINKNHTSCETWGQGKGNAATRKSEQWLEMQVSPHISTMRVLILPLDNNRDFAKIVKYIENNSTALLSNFQRTVIDEPSSGWLGRHCSNTLVRDSGLWNTSAVMNKYDDTFLELFKKLIEVSLKCNIELKHS